MPTHENYEKEMQTRFAQLPPVIRAAITSADIQKHLRELADSHQLHLDQWTLLENEVMLALLGFERVEDLAKNIQSEVGVSSDIARSLAADISTIVFAPIRQELERQLDHPNATAEVHTAVENARTQTLAKEHAAPAAVVSTPIMPATPSSAPVVTAKVERAPLSTTYAPSQPSHERKAIEGDPYREQLI